MTQQWRRQRHWRWQCKGWKRIYSYWITSHDIMAHAHWQLSFPFEGVVMGSYFSPPSLANCEQICGGRVALHVAFCPNPELIHHRDTHWDAASTHHRACQVKDCSGSPCRFNSSSSLLKTITVFTLYDTLNARDWYSKMQTTQQNYLDLKNISTFFCCGS